MKTNVMKNVPITSVENLVVKSKRPSGPGGKSGPGSQIITPSSNRKIREDHRTSEGRAFASPMVEGGGDAFLV
jgi:hypothetical protein